MMYSSVTILRPFKPHGKMTAGFVEANFVAPVGDVLGVLFTSNACIAGIVADVSLDKNNGDGSARHAASTTDRIPPLIDAEVLRPHSGTSTAVTNPTRAAKSTHSYVAPEFPQT